MNKNLTNSNKNFFLSLKRVFLITLIFSVSLIGFITLFSQEASAATYTARTTSEMTQAISKARADGGGTVYLKGPATFTISKTVMLSSNIVLTGDRSAVIKLVPRSNLGKGVPLISAPSGSRNIKITGFTIDGNSEAQTVRHGLGYHNMIYFDRASNVEVSNMRMQWGKGDGFKINRSNNIRFTNNNVYNLGHDAFYTTNSCSNGVVSGNTVVTRANSAFRLSGGATNFKITNNNIDGKLSRAATGPGIEIDKTSAASNAFNNIEISNNKFSNLCGSGIWMFSRYPSDSTVRARGVHIHHNTFTNVGQYGRDNGRSSYGILLQNFDNTIIENNRFSNCGTAVVKWGGEVPQQPAKFTTIVRNNVLSNTKVGIMNTANNNRFVAVNNQFSNVVTNHHGNGFGSSSSSSSSTSSSTTQNNERTTTEQTSTNAVTMSSLMTAERITGYANKEIPFRAAATRVNSRNIRSFSWNFGDGSPAVSDTKATITKTYSRAGTYRVTLVATDTSGRRYTDYLTATVRADNTNTNSGTTSNNRNAVTNTNSNTVSNSNGDVVAATSLTGTVRKGVSFTASPTINGKKISQYTWNFGHGPSVSSRSYKAVKTYSRAGTYRVSVVATDVSGTRYTDSLTVTIR